VITRLRRGATGTDSAGQVRQVLLRFGGIERATLLPDDPKAVDRAMAEAIAVVDAAPRSQLAKQLDALALRLAHVADTAAPIAADLQSDRSLVQ
jgi:MinD-like ATPase involved in chromosome partitioning or flagellar assembly